MMTVILEPLQCTSDKMLQIRVYRYKHIEHELIMIEFTYPWCQFLRRFSGSMLRPSYSSPWCSSFGWLPLKFWTTIPKERYQVRVSASRTSNFKWFEEVGNLGVHCFGMKFFFLAQEELHLRLRVVEINTVEDHKELVSLVSSFILSSPSVPIHLCDLQDEVAEFANHFDICHFTEQVRCHLQTNFQ